ncbi:MAG: TspO/MBR family protein [Oscillatoria sp. PMC 1051.18]|nr:TspO/MBR family protein [Oscillatoria sp. PMC 1050.18]MEC5032814.1 TspO/MBR family protein [Oscillatoria sp. PMC 1051.18]
MIKSWMVIGGVTLLVALGSNLVTPDGVRWFKRQQRPRWLTFEWAIPFIWTFIFICGAWSAYIIWESDPGTTETWLLMGFYLLLEVAIVAYTPVMFALRSLKIGTIVGAVGTVLGLVLTLIVLSISGWAALLLLPYLLWSPIGTYTTWEMMQLNNID